MTAGIIFINLALVLYTIAIWSERIKKTLKPWMLSVFSMAFASDLTGTSIMFLTATNRFSYGIHSISGYLALIIMGLHLIWAILAIRNEGNYEKYFTKFSIVAWIVWLVAFTSGALGHLI